MASAAPQPSASELGSCAAFMGADIKSSGDMGKEIWLIETLAGQHMTGDLSLISNLTPVIDQVVPAGICEGKLVHGTGSVNTGTVVLPAVWYVPGLLENLISVPQLTIDPDLFIGIAGSGCLVTKISDGSVVGRARLRSDNKYEVDFLRIPQN